MTGPDRAAPRALAGLLLALALLVGPGCASGVGTALRPRPYVGTCIDSQIIGGRFVVLRGSGPHPAEYALALLDTPLSFAVDTLLLPYTVPAWLLSNA